MTLFKLKTLYDNVFSQKKLCLYIYIVLMKVFISIEKPKTFGIFLASIYFKFIEYDH